MTKGHNGDAVDYVKIYSLEQYLFETVGPQFLKRGDIDPADFYMIVIWKANRAKTRIKKRLDKKAGSFAAAVKTIASSLHRSDSPESRLKVLMTEWKFRLPMATAILTVLYPTEFTVYDVRVCDELRGFHKLSYREFSEGLWIEYQRFIDAVKLAAPIGLNLRDKDRYLWGKSFHTQVIDDLKQTTLKRRASP